MKNLNIKIRFSEDFTAMIKESRKKLRPFVVVARGEGTKLYKVMRDCVL